MCSDIWNENSRTIQEHFKNISIIFKNTSDVKNIITIDFLKKAYSHSNQRQIQISTRTKLWKS